jgi:peptide/nickel transport system ATP-binding protein
MQTNEKVLFRIRGLKQYFPVKGSKKQFVKANDGIDLDIYEGETFGLVGESGCGKSTLGRVLLQLYRQTYGRTLYYGRTADEIAPDYVRQTVVSLPSGLRKMREREKARDETEARVTALKSSAEPKTRLYDQMEELNRLSKSAEDAYLDIAQIIGGLMVADDLAAVSSAYLSVFQAARARRRVREERERQQMELDDAVFAGNKSRDAGRKAGRIQTKLKLTDERLERLDQSLKERQAELETLRSRYENHPEFAKHEAFREVGIDLARLNYNEMRVLRRDMQLIFQDPYSSLNPRMTVGQIIGEGLRTHNFFRENGERQQAYTLEVMEKCGLAPYMLHRYPHQFSGGQRQRIGIARSLAVKPRFVVCDEAVSALDVSIQSQVINLLQDLREQENLTYLFISHDLSVIKYISDRIGVMYLGNIVELTGAAELFANPMHPYTAALLAAIPTTDPGASKEHEILEGDIPSPINPPKGCKFHTRCKHCTDICRQVTPEFAEVRPGHFVACHHMVGSADAAAQTGAGKG